MATHLFSPTSQPLPPSKRVKYNKTVTIAAGFYCADGIVLAADSQYSGGGSKTSGQKIFPIQQNDRFAVTLATAGHAGIAKRTIQKLTDSLKARIGHRAASIAELQDILEDVLCDVHAKYIYSAPADERAIVDVWFLMAAWTPHEYALFRSDVTAVTRVYGSACIGVGSYLGEYLMDLLCDYSPGMSVEDVKPIASYVVDRAKNYVDGCGLRTFMRVLTAAGIDEAIQPKEILAGEEYFEGVFGLIRKYLLSLHASTVDDSFSVLFGAALDEFTEKQRERKAKLDRVAQSRLQSTKDDPSRPPPSPE